MYFFKNLSYPDRRVAAIITKIICYGSFVIGDFIFQNNPAVITIIFIIFYIAFSYDGVSFNLLLGNDERIFSYESTHIGFYKIPKVFNFDFVEAHTGLYSCRIGRSVRNTTYFCYNPSAQEFFAANGFALRSFISRGADT